MQVVPPSRVNLTRFIGQNGQRILAVSAILTLASFLAACSDIGGSSANPTGSTSPAASLESGTWQIVNNNSGKDYFSCSAVTQDGKNVSTQYRYWNESATLQLVGSQYIGSATNYACATLAAKYGTPVKISSNIYLNNGSSYAGLRITPALVNASTGQKMLNGLAQIAPDQQALAVRQITGQTVTRDMQSGLKLGQAGSQGVNQRLAALSSQLAITDGQAAIKRANLAGNVTASSQSALSLANQSLDAGRAGMWVSLSNNNAITGQNINGSTSNLQAGQDIALSRDMVIGVAASSSTLTQVQSGESPSYLTGNVIAGNVYLTYSPDLMRFTAQAGGQSGNLQQYRMMTAFLQNTAYGKTSFTGSSAELRLGYELGDHATSTKSPFSLIPTIAVGYRAQIAAGYLERATSDYLALAIPQLKHSQNYAAIGMAARAVFKGEDVSALPRASISVERINSRLGQQGVVALAIDPTAQFDTNLGEYRYSTVTRYDIGIDVVGSDNNAVALRADYQGSYSSIERVNALTVGMKVGF